MRNLITFLFLASTGLAHAFTHTSPATKQPIVDEIEAAWVPIASNSELITRLEKKVQATLARVWSEETGEQPL